MQVSDTFSPSRPCAFCTLLARTTCRVLHSNTRTAFDSLCFQSSLAHISHLFQLLSISMYVCVFSSSLSLYSITLHCKESSSAGFLRVFCNYCSFPKPAARAQTITQVQITILGTQQSMCLIYFFFLRFSGVCSCFTLHCSTLFLHFHTRAV